MAGLTGMLAEQSPFMDDESRQSMSDAQDKGPGVLKGLLDPGFQAMHDDPSTFNAAMLGLGVTPLGPAGRAAGGAVNLGRKVVDRGMDSIMNMWNKSRTASKEGTAELHKTVKEFQERFGLNYEELARAHKSHRIHGTVDELGVETFTEVMGELAPKHAWQSRLTPAMYERRVREGLDKIEDVHRRTGESSAFQLTPEIKKNYLDLPSNRQAEVMQELEYKIKATKNAHKYTLEDAAKLAENVTVEGADAAGKFPTTDLGLNDWARELSDQYDSLVRLRAFLQDL